MKSQLVLLLLMVLLLVFAAVAGIRTYMASHPSPEQEIVSRYGKEFQDDQRHILDTSTKGNILIVRYGEPQLADIVEVDHCDLASGKLMFSSAYHKGYAFDTLKANGIPY